MPKKSNFQHRQLIHMMHSFLDSKNIFWNGMLSSGVCNGFKNMWIQAVLQGEVEEEKFYKRLDKLAHIYHHKMFGFKKDIANIYQSQLRADKTLTPAEVDLIEMRAFFESIALQQGSRGFGIFQEFIPQNSPIIDKLTLSKKL